MNKKIRKNEVMETIDTFLETKRVPLGYKNIKFEKNHFRGGYEPPKLVNFDFFLENWRFWAKFAHKRDFID